MLFGVGINDAGYTILITKRIGNGKTKTIWACPYYSKWTGMLERCYSTNFKIKHPTYKDVTCCKEWLLFSNFKAWMEQQDWEGKDLDKDLLFYGNKIYSAETCCFISNEVNTLLLTSQGTRGDLPLGVRYTNKSKGMKNERAKPYSAQLTNRRLEKSYVHIGYFKSPEEAHRAWQLSKCNLIIDISCNYKRESKEYEVLLKSWDRIYDDYIENRETISI